MSLPIRTTLDDIDAICSYLIGKPTGATMPEAKAVMDKKHLDGRKLTAFRFWGFIEDEANKIKVTELGRRYAKATASGRAEALRDVIREIKPYAAIIERAAHRKEETIAATDVAAHWHEHFRDEVSESEKTLNDQAVCFFQFAQGAGLGALIIGRKGMPTRFDFDVDAALSHLGGPVSPSRDDVPTDQKLEVADSASDVPLARDHDLPDGKVTRGDRVFITHGKNRKILNQVKEIVAYGKFEPIVAMEHETAAKPVPKKVMDDMRTCKAAVLHVGLESVLYDKDHNEVPQINQNVLIEIGAAMALYRDKFVLLVEEGVELPSNLQGLYECRYEGDELNMPATMKLLKAFSEF